MMYFNKRGSTYGPDIYRCGMGKSKGPKVSRGAQKNQDQKSLNNL